MKIKHVKSLIFIFCITIIPSLMGAGNTLGEILNVYPNIEGMSLEFPSAPEGTLVTLSGNALIEKLTSLTTLPEEWVKSMFDEKTPLEIIAKRIKSDEYVIVRELVKAGQIPFLCNMIEKLLASGEKRRLKCFEAIAYNPQLCLAFLKNLNGNDESDAAFLQEE